MARHFQPEVRLRQQHREAVMVLDTSSTMVETLSGPCGYGGPARALRRYCGTACSLTPAPSTAFCRTWVPSASFW